MGPVFALRSLLGRLRPDEVKYMNRAECPRAGTIVSLTSRGRIVLAAEALAAAEKTANQQRRKTLCEQAIAYLRDVVRGALIERDSARQR